MAELNLERKERSVWPWLLLALLLLALLLWFLFGRGSDDRGVTGLTDTAAVDTVARGDAGRLPDEVDRFVQFAQSPPGDAPGREHEYTATGLRHLADALGAVSRDENLAGADLDRRISGIRERADALQRDPAAGTHARQTREALILASNTMRQMQEQRRGELGREFQELNDAATAVSADGQLMEQTPRVRQFFERAADALRQLARRQ